MLKLILGKLITEILEDGMMWEYAVIHEFDSKWVVVQGEGAAKSRLEVRFKSPTKSDWPREGDILKHAKQHSEDTIAIFDSIEWNAESPRFEPKEKFTSKSEIYRKFMNKSNRKYWLEIFGAEPESVEMISSGWTIPIYEADTVTQVLSKAGQDGWELIGNVPSGTNRMLRREL